MTGDPLGCTRTVVQKPGGSAIGLNGIGVSAPVLVFTENALSVLLVPLIA